MLHTRLYESQTYLDVTIKKYRHHIRNQPTWNHRNRYGNENNWPPTFCFINLSWIAYRHWFIQIHSLKCVHSLTVECEVCFLESTEIGIIELLCVRVEMTHPDRWRDFSKNIRTLCYLCGCADVKILNACNTNVPTVIIDGNTYAA